MKLEELPVEILALILDGPLSWASVALWKSGSPPLLSKLMNGGIKDVVLTAEPWNTRAVWPKCLKHFRLRSLSVNTVRTPSSFDGLQNELKQLFSGIESLELLGSGVTQAFNLERPFPPSPGEPLASPPSSTAQAVSPIIEDKKREVLWDMNATHPRLQHLKLGGLSTPHPSLCFGNCELLPRSLTSLDIQKTAFQVNSANLSRLPPNLRSLAWSGHCRALSEDDLRNLPASLTSITYDGDISPILDYSAMLALVGDPTLLPQLPPSVRVNIDMGRAITTFYGSHNSQWPSDIRSLTVKGDLETWEVVGKSLPTRLTSLHINPRFSQFIDSRWIQETLPISLTSFTASSIDWSIVSDASIWPPNLMLFELLDDREVSPKHHHLLPRSLKTLALNKRLNNYFHNDWGLGPYKMEALFAHGRACLQDTENQSWSTLREALLLSAKGTQGCYGVEETEKYISAIESGGLFGLPLSLTDLALGPLNTNDHLPVLLLPPSIKRLELNTAFGTQHLRKFLPPSLTEARLSIHALPNIVIADTPEKTALYNANITRLELNAGHGQDLALYLPRGLKHLTYKLEFRVTASDLARLPSGLTYLNLQTPNIQPEELWSSSLPASLRHLKVAFTSRGSDLSCLPRGLETFEPDLVATNVTFEDAMSAPRKLNITRLLHSSFLRHGHRLLRPLGRPSWQALNEELKKR